MANAVMAIVLTPPPIDSLLEIIFRHHKDKLICKHFYSIMHPKKWCMMFQESNFFNHSHYDYFKTEVLLPRWLSCY